MRERPILFSAPMVRAILSGAKTQTRRLVQPVGVVQVDGGGAPFTQRWDVDEQVNWRRDVRCPYGVPGDRLWVREACIIADKDFPDFKDPNWPRDNDGVPRVVQYLASQPDRVAARDYGYAKATPSIHMPRWASRFTLEVTDVRVQRLQDISEEDAKAEGVEPLQMDFGSYLPSFQGVWDLLNSKRAPWASNPWVWAISFKRIEG